MNDLWVQSLLLVPGQAMLEMTQELAERKQVNLPLDVPDPSRLTTKSFSAPLQHISMADLCRDQPFWTARLNLFGSQQLEDLGNEVVVNTLPVKLSFFMYSVICGRQDAEYSWEVTGPHQNTPLQTVLVSLPKKLVFLPLNVLPGISVQSNLGLKIARIYERVLVTLMESGLYFVSLKLNGEEGNKLPLVIRHWGSDAQDNTVCQGW